MNFFPILLNNEWEMYLIENTVRKCYSASISIPLDYTKVKFSNLLNLF